MKRLRQMLESVVPPMIVFVVVVAAVEAYVRLRGVPRYLMPLPSAIGQSLVTDRGQLLSALGWTSLSAVGGFITSAVFGAGAAVVLSSSSLVRRAIYPYTIFFQTVPIVAIAPLLLFWFGAGPTPVVVCAVIVSIFPVIANTLAGLLSTDPALLDLFRLYGAGRWATLMKLRLPSSLPMFFTGLRVAAGLAVIGTVVAELFVGEIIEKAGLGVLIVDGIHQSHLAIAFAAILLASMLGLAMFIAVNFAGWLCLRQWHASERRSPRG